MDIYRDPYTGPFTHPTYGEMQVFRRHEDLAYVVRLRRGNREVVIAEHEILDLKFPHRDAASLAIGWLKFGKEWSKAYKVELVRATDASRV